MITSEKCEIRRTTTPRRTFKKIAEEMAKPIAIIIVGIDGKPKTRAQREYAQQLPNFAVYQTSYTDNAGLEEARQNVIEGRNVIIVLDEALSCDHRSRRSAATILKKTGAKTTVGVYAERNPRFSLSSIEIQRRRFFRNPPSSDEFDYLVIIPEN